MIAVFVFIAIALYVYIAWCLYTGTSWLEVFDETHGKPRDE